MSLNSISPLDGRYEKTTKELAAFYSDKALMHYRIMVEGEYLIALSELKTKLRKLTPSEKEEIRALYDVTEKDAEIILDIETKGYKNIKATDHDVKAIEYFMKDKLAETSVGDVLEWLHFALTSYDTNTLARGLMLSDVQEKVIVPKLNQIVDALDTLAREHAELPMLARTHGQPASPTTFGKEFKVFSERLKKQIKVLGLLRVSVKWSGASGNYNAQVAAYPEIDWQKFAQDFIESFNKNRQFKVELNEFTTQIDPHDREVSTFDCLRRINTILIGLNQDIWRYISDEWIIQRPSEGAVGSSTMPHKINPIKFENSEGNLGLANALFEFFGRKLPISRLQRDLSDSTVERNFGTAFAYSLIAYDNLLKGLGRVEVNKEKVLSALREHPEVIAEAIQTILRREGVAMPYEKLKELTRGRVVSLADIHDFINTLEVSDKVKKELIKITPENYTGLASSLAAL